MPSTTEPAAAQGKLAALLGPELLNKSGVVSTSSLTVKFIGLYFSASWCPPCRAFTPKLAQFYADFQARHAAADDFDIVFVSSDKTPVAAEDYYEGMPWLMMPFEDRSRKEGLTRKCQVTTIPTLAVIDATTGAIVTTAGRDAVDADPTGARFPWTPPSLLSLAQGPVATASGRQSDFDSVARGKVTGLYFSAHWCPPCRRFTPQLVDFYNSKKGTPEEFEVVFVSRDREEGEYEAYRSEMPWWAYPLDRHENMRLAALCGVQSIPNLTLVDTDGTVLTTKAADLLRADPSAADWPYRPRPVQRLSAAAGPTINAARCCIAFAEDATEAEGVLRAAAEAEFAKEEHERSMFFFVGDSRDEFSRQVMQVLGIEADGAPQLAFTALPDFCVLPLPKSADDAQRLIRDFQAQALTMQTLAE